MEKKNQHLFKDTLNADAIHYLDQNGLELERQTWLNYYLALHIHNFYSAYMLYVGPGYVKLTFAVIAKSVEEASEVMEEWCRDNDKLDEIAEDDPDNEYFGEYELHSEPIPTPVAVMPVEYEKIIKELDL